MDRPDAGYARTYQAIRRQETPMLVLANNDTLFTGFSGVLIFLVIVWLVVRTLRKT
jgi:hypothetical protein